MKTRGSIWPLSYPQVQLVLEYCNYGSLRLALDKGVFFEPGMKALTRIPLGVETS